MKKSILFFLALSLSSSLWAQRVAQLGGISYGRTAAPDGQEWQAPERYAHGKEQPKAYFFSFASEEEAKGVLPEKSSYHRSLDGKWAFHWVGNPSERPVDFYKPSYDVSGWNQVDVPMNWNVYGLQKDGTQRYGTPIYVNQPVIFQHRVAVDDWRGGVMRTPPTTWSTYKNRNEVGSYRRTFTIPAGWKGRQVLLNFDGVDSFFYLWVNGKYVGFSKNSRNLAAFDISDLVIEGENTVAVEVYRSSDGSFLEAQDMFRLPGIFRSVYLTSKPLVQIYDLQAIPTVNTNASEATLKISANIRNLGKSTSKLGNISYQLYRLPLYSDTGATLVAEAVGELSSLKAGQHLDAKCSLGVQNPLLWSAEAPHRHLLITKLHDSKGRVLETVSFYTGLRQVEIRDTPAQEDEFGLAGRYFYVNGKTIKFKGVNRHETHPERGHAITREQMLEEVMMMKRANINHVRNSHYPTDPYFYYLCDKYGIYLEDEANIESHQYYYGDASLSHVKEFDTAHTNRMLEMVHANINYPSIVIWSLGNEAGPGENFVRSYNATKRVDTSRPIQYERNNEIVDMGSNQYPSIANTYQLASGKTKAKYPFHISEYAHSMGNAVGGLVDYWKAIESTNFICGGAIWDWKDQSLYNYTKDGLRYMAYGGDFGDTPNDGMFVMNGIIFADQTPKPQYYEVKKVYQNIAVTAEDIQQGKVRVFNKNYFTALSDYTLRWSLYKDGVAITQGTTEAVASIPARSSAVVALDARQFAQLSSEHEYFLKLEFLLASDKPWAKKGYVQADEQLLVSSATARPTLSARVQAERGADKLSLKIDRKGKSVEAYTVSGRDFTVRFDALSSRISQLSYGTEQIISNVEQGPALSLFRAPVDNDIWAWGSWGKNGLLNLQHTVRFSNSYQRADGSYVLHFSVRSQAPYGAKLYDHRASGRYKIEPETSQPFGEDDFYVDTEQVWTIYKDGTLELETSFSSNKPNLALGRLGFEMIVPKRYERYSYYGRGPINNYSDRKTSQFIELHHSTVAQQFVNFPKPQSMGNREDVRWTSLTDANGAGILVVAKDKMSTSALPWSAQELTLAPHPHELPAAGDTHLHIDATVNGLGGFSCGQGPPLKDCQSFATAQHFGFAIRPLSAGASASAQAQVSLSGDGAPIIERNKLGAVRASRYYTDGQLLYSVNGSKPKTYGEQEEREGIDMKQGGTIRLWDKAQSKLISSVTYPRVENIPLSIAYVSSQEIHGGESATHLLDGDPNTIWHSTYSVTVAQYPHWVDFDAASVQTLRGFSLLPRQDSSNGRIKEYKIYVSLDNKEWTEVHQGNFANANSEQRVLFAQPVRARYIRLMALSSHQGNDFASASEFKVLVQ